MEYKFTKYTPEHSKSFAKLLDNSFSIENQDKEALVRWKLFDKYHKGKTITYVALNRNNSVVGQYTNFPIRVACRNNVFNSMICADMTTDINHRGKGLISRLSEKVYSDVVREKYSFSIGFSNDEGVKVDRNASGYGYQVVGKFVRYFKVIVYKKNISAKLVYVKKFGKDSQFGPGTHYLRLFKDYTYLNWRYVRKPNNEYTLYEVKEGNSSFGYVVLRLKGRRCYIYDILVSQVGRTRMRLILRCIENKALAEGARVIIYNVLDNRFWQNLFSRYKYFKKENNKVNYFLTVKKHASDISDELLFDKENWILMNGDIL